MNAGFVLTNFESMVPRNIVRVKVIGGWETKDQAASCHAYSFIPSLKNVRNFYSILDAVPGAGKRTETRQNFSPLGACFLFFKYWIEFPHLGRTRPPDKQTFLFISSRLYRPISSKYAPTFPWNVYHNIDISAWLDHVPFLKIEKTYFGKKFKLPINL